MLGPIPQSLLVDSVTIKVCNGVDAWQKPTWDEYQVSNVHLQDTNEVRKTKENTEVLLRSILFIDAKNSAPELDYRALASQSEAAGKPMRAIVSSANGTVTGDFEVLVVDVVPNVPATGVHHVELGMM